MQVSLFGATPMRFDSTSIFLKVCGVRLRVRLSYKMLSVLELDACSTKSCRILVVYIVFFYECVEYVKFAKKETALSILDATDSHYVLKEY